MKKFLPLIIFMVVFAAVLAGQIGLKMFQKDSITETASANPEYAAYENSFLHAQYKTLDGKELQMTKVNSPVVIYNFWASWCQPCLAEMPSMIALKKRFKPEEVSIIAINTDEEDQKNSIQKTLSKLKITNEFIIVPDQDAKLVNEFKVSAIPVTIIYHRGKVVHFSNGPMDFNSEEIFEKLKGWVAN